MVVTAALKVQRSVEAVQVPGSFQNLSRHLLGLEISREHTFLGDFQ